MIEVPSRIWITSTGNLRDCLSAYLNCLKQGHMQSLSTIAVKVDRLPDCTIFPARKEHTATVFFLHVGFLDQIRSFTQLTEHTHSIFPPLQGLGDTAKNIGYLLGGLTRHPDLEHVRFVLPTA